MKPQKHIVFAMSEVGASHIPEGKPCQDFSLKVDENGVRMVVVCDGHGSSTYIRSDIGARLAAEVTKEAVMDFVQNTPPELFKDRKGAVGVRPTVEDIRRGAKADPAEDPTESGRKTRQQNQTFFSQVKDILPQDIVIVALLRNIYSSWLTAIRNHCSQHPLSDAEKAALGNKTLVKAYGTTLMAFVETPHYWLSFHIGDGRIVTVDQDLSMTNPVPWDSDCFLNITTSLCNSRPVRLFRYAFDGTGAFPAAVLCCSDGIEDSYGDYELAPHFLHEWYRGVLSEFCRNGESATLEQMKIFFPRLSQKGSKDDISLAGIIDTEATAKAIENDIRQQLTEIERQLETGRRQAEDHKCRMEDLDRQKNELEQKLIMMGLGAPDSGEGRMSANGEQPPEDE